MIKAVIFDLDNTLLDFMKMKSVSINAAVDGMIKSGMSIDKEASISEIFNIYDTKGYEHQEVFNEFIVNKVGLINYKFLAASIVAKNDKHKIGVLFINDGVYQVYVSKQTVSAKVKSLLSRLDKLAIDELAVAGTSIKYRHLDNYKPVINVDVWSKHDVRIAFNRYEVITQL